jgi:hypothetical protein
MADDGREPVSCRLLESQRCRRVLARATIALEIAQGPQSGPRVRSPSRGAGTLEFKRNLALGGRSFDAAELDYILRPARAGRPVGR